MSLLTREMRAAVGRSLPPVTVEATRREIRKYAVATGQRLARYLRGDEAPPLFTSRTRFSCSCTTRRSGTRTGFITIGTTRRGRRATPIW
ncbi:MAG TPA: hypothetical protein VFA95_08870 [Gammaproteobacteria bacterium]|nr:hypothetical protein [Gammaproteobacteria bacterium]